jgi:hypothetical protein
MLGFLGGLLIGVTIGTIGAAVILIFFSGVKCLNLNEDQ